MAEQTQGSGLFMDYKLGEANEIKAALRELSSNKASEARQKRDQERQQRRKRKEMERQR